MGRFDERAFARYTTWVAGMAGVLISLGIYTAASGSGLACAQQWPLCDGGVLPGSIPSFVEWFHRLWAMVTGFAIFGVAVWATRVAGRRLTTAAVAAAVLTPLQAIFGAITVTLEGAIPGGYSAPVHAAHFLTGVTIFTLLTYTALSSRDDTATARTPSARSALWLGAVAVVGVTLTSRGIGVVRFAPAVQTLYFLLGLGTLAALLAAGRRLTGRRRLLIAVAGVGLLVALLLSRDLVFYNGLVQLAHNVVTGGTAAIVTALALTEPPTDSSEASRAPAGD